MLPGGCTGMGGGTAGGSPPGGGATGGCFPTGGSGGGMSAGGIGGGIGGAVGGVLGGAAGGAIGAAIGSAVGGQLGSAAGGMLGDGCWGGGAGDLGGMASGALNSLASAAMGQLLAVKDSDPMALAIGKHLASQYGQQALDALKDPAAIEKKLKALFEGVESKASVKLAWGTVPSSVVINKKYFGLRRTDPAAITQPPDIGEVVEGNDVVLIGDLPAAGEGFIVIGKKATVGEIDLFSTNVLMGGGSSIEIPDDLIEEPDQSETDQDPSSDDRSPGNDNGGDDHTAAPNTHRSADTASSVTDQQSSSADASVPSNENRAPPDHAAVSADDSASPAVAQAERVGQGVGVEADEQSNTSAENRPPPEVTERLDQLSRETIALSEARDQAQAMHARGELTNAEYAEYLAREDEYRQTVLDEAAALQREYPIDEVGNLIPDEPSGHASSATAEVDTGAEDSGWGEIALELGKDVIGISDLEDAYEAYEQGEYWSAAASLAMVLPWAKVFKLLKIFAKLVKAGKSFGNAGAATKRGLSRLAAKLGDETGAIDPRLLGIVGKGASKRAPLKPLHTDSLSKAKLDRLEKASTDDLIKSLEPGQPGSLKVKPDGTIMDGNHRIRILRERGIDVDSLPREPHG